ncbi:putative MFS family arabinose efflux permease [Nakamurella sp. UYEF19]|uniref:MFS transporter n=1 Tax=Nakamurella sp. UYEF19 TaxID=1756392 RepID=UPI00339516BB
MLETVRTAAVRGGRGFMVSEEIRDRVSAQPRFGLKVVTWALAIACGLTVANLYYAQPLLEVIADSFHVTRGAAGVVVTATQLGYALALALVLPLGDLLENRTLACRTLVGTSLALGAAAFVPDFGLFLAASVLIGVTSVVAQILVPFAAHLAPPDQRGRFVGQVMSGLLLGILLARTLSSLVAAAFGWQTIYVISAVLMLLLSAALRVVLPRRRPTRGVTYGALLKSVVHLLRTEPVLRHRALVQALQFAAFSSFWTSIAYQLISQFGLSQAQVGIFALVGAAGAAAAPLAGRLGDRGHGHLGRFGAILVGVLSMVLAGFGSSSVVLLAIAAVLLDLAVQGHQVLGQRDIYALGDEVRARLNTVYMTTIFIGGAIGSAVSGLLYQHVGWVGVSIFGGLLFVASAAVWTFGHVRGDRGR